MRRLLLVVFSGLSLLVGVPALAAWGAPVGVPADARAGVGTVPADPRIAAAVTAWKTSPLYVDRLFAGSLGSQESDLRRQIAAMPLPVYVAVVPHGEWFAEKGDTVRLAGWLATANGKPGVYVVVNRTDATGAAHLVRAYAPTRAYDAKEHNPPAQLEAYLEAIEPKDRLDAGPARTAALPERPERVYEPERFTVGSALANGLSGFMIGAIGGALAAGLLVPLAALVGRRRGGHR